MIRICGRKRARPRAGQSSDPAHLAAASAPGIVPSSVLTSSGSPYQTGTTSILDDLAAMVLAYAAANVSRDNEPTRVHDCACALNRKCTIRASSCSYLLPTASSPLIFGTLDMYTKLRTCATTARVTGAARRRRDADARLKMAYSPSKATLLVVFTCAPAREDKDEIQWSI
ncbi:hypothetical protein ACJJTC_014245 [Scirpophaga incertulas]